MAKGVLLIDKLHATFEEKKCHDYISCPGVKWGNGSFI